MHTSARTLSSVKVALSRLVGDGIGGFLSTDHQMCDDTQLSLSSLFLVNKLEPCVSS